MFYFVKELVEIKEKMEFNLKERNQSKNYEI
jgi:hypothetical protein